ncbi:MAG: hypothetical protein PGN33_20055 [Methylobacterium radiotolerans]
MRSALVLIVLSATAHAAPGVRAPAPVMPSDKAVILDWARQTLADPYSLRSTGISAPLVSPDGSGMVCIEFNARNALGGYTGIERMAFVWTPTGLRPATRGLGGITNLTCYQPGAAMRPFPELSQIK